MSTPKILSYPNDPEGSDLSSAWGQPSGSYPDHLWPERALRTMSPEPVDWVTIREHWTDDDGLRRAFSCLLIESDAVEAAFERDRWIGRDVGTPGRRNDHPLETGLVVRNERGSTLEFFCRVRHHHRLQLPSVEFSHPFVWYWDAMPRSSGLVYLDIAGRDRELARWSVEDDDRFRVEVRALELRRYLFERDLLLLIQFDHHVVHDAYETDSFPDAESVHSGPWAAGSWHCTSERGLGSGGAFSRLLGKYVVYPAETGANPRSEERQEQVAYPEFQYAVDTATGRPRRHTCDPDALGSYYDSDESKLHYLTPINFRPEVLGRYTAEPSRYDVSSTAIRCLDLWLLEISTNTAGLIEVYLGDLGNQLPADELPHWLSHNVAPSGLMAEDRFRRDFLNQFASTEDLPHQLKEARAQVAQAAHDLVGTPVWRDLPEPLSKEFERVHRPTTSDPSSLYVPLLTITKALFDSIDPKPLRQYLGEESKEPGSLELLERLEGATGGDGEATQTLRSIQQLRSQGGSAHLPNSGSQRAIRRAKVEGLAPAEAFDELCRQATGALRILATQFTTHQG